MAIDIGQVEPGDLVFTYDAPDLAVPGTATGHVMLVGEADRQGIVTQIHQVRGGMGNAFPGTQRERLVPNSPKAAGVAGSRKRIVRCNDRYLARRAARQALYWQKWFQLDFSEERITNAGFFEQKASGSELVDRLRSLFDSTGKYRAIKYAARRKSFLCYPDREGKSGQGMFCSMFVVICYQVAGLEDGYVKAADHTDTMLRISDKKMTPKDHRKVGEKLIGEQLGKCGRLEFENFVQYTEKLKDPNPYELDDPQGGEASGKNKKLAYRPSIEYWNFEKCPSIIKADWKGIFTKGMMVDSKIVMPRGLYDSLLDDKEGWTDMGDLVGQQTTEDAAALAERRKLLAADMTVRRQSWVKGKVV